LDVLRRMAAGAPGWLAPGGHLLVESGEAQAAEAIDVLARCGLAARSVSDDELGATVIVAVAPTAQETIAVRLSNY
jgi:release factor glutamine methyltransferase